MPDAPHPLHTLNTYDLLVAAGIPEEHAEKGQTLITGFVQSGMIRSEFPNDGLLYYLRVALEGLASLRSDMLFQPGDRVMLRDDSLEPEAERWARKGMDAMRATFGEVGTVIRNDYNGYWGYWSVIVKFDREWWQSHDGTIHEKEDGKLHVWNFSPKSLRQVTL
jgi:hypothetical protein